MTPSNSLLILAASLLAGAINSVAGGGSFFSFPALLYTGVAAIPANATNTVALWPGSLASVYAYRRELKLDWRQLTSLIIVSMLGGLLGALLLLKTPDRTFLMMLPLLLLGATLMFAYGGKLTNWLNSREKRASKHSWIFATLFTIVQLTIATYGGYFGGGIGMLMLAMLSLMGLEDIHTMNAVKTLLASCINGIAVITFILARAVFWPQALLMVVGAVMGGYAGAHYAQKMSPSLVKRFVLLVGYGMAVYFFFRYR